MKISGFLANFNFSRDFQRFVDYPSSPNDYKKKLHSCLIFNEILN